MAVTPASFKAARPEFRQLTDTQVQAALDEAALLVDTEVWGDRTDMGVSYRAAHLLALSPHGKAARLITRGNEGDTLYNREFRRLQRVVGSGYRVV